MRWLIAVVLSAACSSASTPDANRDELASAARCRQVVDHIMALDAETAGSSTADSEYLKSASDSLLESCTNTWSNAAADCLLALKKGDRLETCEPVVPQRKKSPVDATRRLVQAFAFEAYPMWAMEHPKIPCPDKLADLVPYLQTRTTTDAWGHGLTMYCGASHPTGGFGAAIVSPGPDGKLGTGDDITSW